LPDGSFGVEVTIPETYPTKMSGFTEKAAAEAWIAEHKNHVATNSGAYRSFGKRLSRGK